MYTLYCIFVLTNLNTVALSIKSSILLQKAQNHNIPIVAEEATSSSAFLAKAASASVVLVQLADSLVEQVLSESDHQQCSFFFRGKGGGRTFFRLDPGACFALRANRSLICCSRACFSALTCPNSPIALLTSVARTFLNSSMWTGDQLWYNGITRFRHTVDIDGSGLLHCFHEPDSLPSNLVRQVYAISHRFGAHDSVGTVLTNRK